MSKSNSKYKVRIMDQSEAVIWDDFIDRSLNGTLFHKYGWMKAAEKQSNTRFYPLVCEKDGEGIISVFPVFSMKKVSLKILFSPPPGCAIPDLGPAFIYNSDKQNRIEADSYETIAAFDNYITNILDPDYIYITSNLEDVRYFSWLGYDSRPLYTYRLFLNRKLDDIYKSFDSRIRNKMKRVEKIGAFLIQNGNAEDLPIMVDKTRARYNQKNRDFKLNEEYLSALYENYSGNGFNVYRCYLDENFLTSFITVDFKKSMKFWHGCINDKEIPNGVNEKIHWHNITHGHKSSFSYYENIGANTKDICTHKSSYGFKPVVYYKIERWPTIKGKLFYTAYNKILRKGNSQE